MQDRGIVSAGCQRRGSANPECRGLHEGLQDGSDGLNHGMMDGRRAPVVAVLAARIQYVARAESHDDSRGVLTLLAAGDVEFNFIEVVTFVSAGVSRGDHYHRVFHEFVYVQAGGLTATLRRLSGSESIMLDVGPGEVIRIEPMTHHVLTAREPTVAISYGYGASPAEDRYRLEHG